MTLVEDTFGIAVACLSLYACTRPLFNCWSICFSLSFPLLGKEIFYCKDKQANQNPTRACFQIHPYSHPLLKPNLKLVPQ